MADEIKPVEPVVTPQATEIPKTKEEWSNLAKTDPGKFAELTQSRMDTIFRQNKEYKEKMTEIEQNNKNLSLELQKYKESPQEESPPTEKYGSGRYPITDDEWNDLFLERPVFATDLRNEFLRNKDRYQQEFEIVREQGAKLVYEEHPDMFVQELDEGGKVKVDGQGKPILKIDPNTGNPYFKSDTEKGQLWLQIYNEDKQNWDNNKNTPRLILAEMERRLRIKGANMVKGQKNITDNDESATAPAGVQPLKVSSAKFHSEEEKVRARQAIARGVYKNEKEFLEWRDSNQTGYIEENRRPDFTKR